MSSTSNPNPWSPYHSYNDCSQGICNIYCPQWCYLIFPPPPPPPFFFNDSSSSSSSNFPPLLIALIGILTSAFLLVSYYTLISKYCHRNRDNSSNDRDGGGFFSSSATESTLRISNTAAGDGLNDSVIKSITVYKYSKGDGFVDGSDCSVCLSEFEENESLRLLPKCNHAFHLPCIDTWLKSHANCPLCRAFVTGSNPTVVPDSRSSSVHHQIAAESYTHGGETVETTNSNMNGHHHQAGDSIVVVEDQEIGSRNSNGRLELQQQEEQRDTKDEEPKPFRRSVSLNSGIVVSIADVLREIEDQEDSAGVGTSQLREEAEEVGRGDGKKRSPTEMEAAASERRGVSNFLVRSLSTGRFTFSRYDRAKNYRLPN